MPRRPRIHWVYRGSRPQPVSMSGQAVFETVPRTLSYSVHPLLSYFLFRVPAASFPLVRSFDPRAHFLPKFQPSLRRHRKHPLDRDGFHPSLRSALRFSQPPDGSRHFRLCRLVSSRCHIQGSSVQGLPSPHSQPDSSPDLYPLAVVRIPSIMTTLAHRPKPAATHAALDFEALLHVKIRSCRVGVNLPEQSIPSSVFTSSRFSLFPPCSRLTRELRS